MTALSLGGGSSIDLNALLALMDNPGAYKQRMTDLITAEASAKDAIAVLRKEQAELDRQRTEFEQMRASMDEDKSNHSDRVAELSAQRDAHSATATQRERNIKTAEDDLFKRRSDLESLYLKRTADFDSRERMISSREKELAQKNAAVEEMKSSLEATIARLKSSGISVTR